MVQISQSHLQRRHKVSNFNTVDIKPGMRMIRRAQKVPLSDLSIHYEQINNLNGMCGYVVKIDDVTDGKISLRAEECTYQEGAGAKPSPYATVPAHILREEYFLLLA
ncbi:MAG: hypothetical protein K0S20_701 [Patescibacteria group bacterium]|jgi:hypothetical protein|nr:hypothetical protein [Patescibacteria group bacterium]